MHCLVERLQAQVVIILEAKPLFLIIWIKLIWDELLVGKFKKKSSKYAHEINTWKLFPLSTYKPISGLQLKLVARVWKREKPLASLNVRDSQYFAPAHEGCEGVRPIYTYSVARWQRGHTRDIIKIIGIVCNYTAILFYGINIYMRSSSKRVTQKYTVGNTGLLRQQRAHTLAL